MSKRPWAESFREPPKVRQWEVRAGDIFNVIEAHYCFNNSGDGEGLIFRRYIDDNPENKTRVVASFANGYWQSYKELDNG